MAVNVDFARAVSPDIGRLGASFYFVPETVAIGRQHGLDGFRFYFLGRGGVLGDVDAKVIESAFGYWSPTLVERIWTSAIDRADVSPREAGHLYHQCAAEFGRRSFAGIDRLDEFCAAAEQVIAAANPAGFALFAAISAETLVDDAPGRAMQLLAVLREFRGSAHLTAVIASDLEPKIAHGIRRPDFWTTFGYDQGDFRDGSAQELDQLAAADALTDRLVAPAYGVLSAPEQSVVLDVIAAINAAVPADAAATA